MADGGTLLIHDAFSSVGVTLAILRELVPGRRFRYVGRSRSLAEYRRRPADAGGSRARNAPRQLAQLPWFARNVALKVALDARATAACSAPRPPRPRVAVLIAGATGSGKRRPIRPSGVRHRWRRCDATGRR